ncbi:aminodeoxychorismate lyase [Mesobacillus selenatarsenatis]|uniref:Aminodeoxychorismate lyase n=1 Tax=Mesobacillus selenatarsenatis (strain DSM 18680 / JCM 14380 / FERM P-15431 / SF-1) TaxID=1321606 RepID=A0A0A8WWG9_MESS1|nr:aminodeoxychorismate lyase [Mesobacillus selenatarsenatis]GAM11923.1 aminodeoxychorismate lyase [Mesobacillus selenatarsenatis SF-1]
MFVYSNGQLVSKDEITISPFDHGFLYGLGVFETFRIYNGHPFLLDDHMERLNASLRVLNIEAEFTPEESVMILEGLLAKNNLKDAYIRFNVSAGNGEIGLQTESYREPNVIVFAKPLPPAGEMSEKKAVLLDLRRNTPEGAERLKSHHYLNNVLAKREAGPAMDTEGIFLTEEGLLAEGIVSNVFWYRDGVLYTPAVETGILNGITRRFVIALARNAGIEVREGLYKKEEAEAADELFLTNSIQEIVPVTDFSGKSFPGKSGELASRLFGKYAANRETLWSRTKLDGGAHT